MHKIGIFTHYYRSQNIGGLLQSYALVAWLNQHNFRAEQITFDFHAQRNAGRLKFLRNLTFSQLLKRIALFPFRRAKRYIKKLTSAESTQLPPASALAEQAQKMAEFEQFIPHSSTYYTDDTIAQANNCYDTFISGSDQVFATYLFWFSAYYCEFAWPAKKRLAYAASSNVTQLSPELELVFTKKLSHLQHISVREKSLKTYIERISPYKATLVLDPTFLLSPQEWLKIATTGCEPQKPYIFCYFLGGQSSWQRKKAQEYADRYGYTVVHLPYIMKSIRPTDAILKGEGRYDVGPREFINLIAHAQCVFTDSFHGLAFSINFGKNFYVFDRDDQSGPLSMNARITDTLNLFALSDRRITTPNAELNNKPLDFTHIHSILQQEKEKSIQWLLNALKN